MKRAFTNEYVDNDDGTTTLSVCKNGVQTRTVKLSTKRRPEVEKYRYRQSKTGELKSSCRQGIPLKALLATDNPHGLKVFHLNGDTNDFTDDNLWVRRMPEYFELSDGSYAIVVPFLMEGREVQLIDYGLPASKIEEIKRHIWFPHYNQYTKSWYLVANHKRKTIRLHRLITGARPGEIVDHIEGVTEHNQLDGLRLVGHAVNARNTCTRSDNFSGFTGVSWSKRNEYWQAYVNVNGKRVFSAKCSTPLEAAHARDNFIRQLPADQRIGFCFNFPLEGEPGKRPKKVT